MSELQNEQKKKVGLFGKIANFFKFIAGGWIIKLATRKNKNRRELEESVFGHEETQVLDPAKVENVSSEEIDAAMQRIETRENAETKTNTRENEEPAKSDIEKTSSDENVNQNEM